MERRIIKKLQLSNLISQILRYLRLQGLFIPFACVGSGDPVRVLHLYTTNTLDTL